jgi:D,D-heptose 1,7-bisphosphate phosphatase
LGKSFKNRAVFLDRDGTIIKDCNYLNKIKDIKVFKGVVEGLQLLKKAGYKLIIVSNQSGIGRGYLTEKKLDNIHVHLKKILRKKNACLDAIYYCPHTPDDNCACRKPKLGLVKKAAKKFKISLNNSFVVGDKIADIELAKNMCGKSVLVLTGHGKKELKKITSCKKIIKPNVVCNNFMAAAKWIISHK